MRNFHQYPTTVALVIALFSGLVLGCGGPTCVGCTFGLAEVRGTLTDTTGAPAAGVLLHVRVVEGDSAVIEAGGWPEYAFEQTTTDSRGEYSVTLTSIILQQGAESRTLVARVTAWNTTPPGGILGEAEGAPLMFIEPGSPPLSLVVDLVVDVP